MCIYMVLFNVIVYQCANACELHVDRKWPQPLLASKHTLALIFKINPSNQGNHWSRKTVGIPKHICTPLQHSCYVVCANTIPLHMLPQNPMASIIGIIMHKVAIRHCNIVGMGRRGRVVTRVCVCVLLGCTTTIPHGRHFALSDRDWFLWEL